MPDNSNKPVILHLARWYPNRYDPMPGLFIQRHVEAAGLYCKVGVVYTHMVEKHDGQNEIYEPEFSIINGVPTAKVYYKSSGCSLLPVKKLVNILRFFKANKIGIRHIKSINGKPELIHVHILTRLGLIAWYNRIIKGIPYVITEHWSRYLDLTGDFKGTARKFFTRLIARRASCITPVTGNLASAMKSHGILNDNYVILPNVVDDVFLKAERVEKPDSEKKIFLHVSCFEDKSKNISGLLRVIAKLSEKRNDFVFRMVGDGMDFESLKKMSSDLGLSDDVIQYTGLLEGSELVNEMKMADALVIFSNYENMPVVINESLSLGVPVIATRVGGIPEVVNPENGILVDPGNEDQLLEIFVRFLDGDDDYDTKSIQKQAVNKYSPQAIGNFLIEIYTSAIG